MISSGEQGGSYSSGVFLGCAPQYSHTGELEITRMGILPTTEGKGSVCRGNLWNPGWIRVLVKRDTDCELGAGVRV